MRGLPNTSTHGLQRDSSTITTGLCVTMSNILFLVVLCICVCVDVWLGDGSCLLYILFLERALLRCPILFF